MDLAELVGMVEARYGKHPSNPGAGHREAAITALERAFTHDEVPE